jgi:hypothetical protein
MALLSLLQYVCVKVLYLGLHLHCSRCSSKALQLLCCRRSSVQCSNLQQS